MHTANQERYIQNIGRLAESAARDWLHIHQIYNMQQLDYLVKTNDNKYLVIEVKHKDIFHGNPRMPQYGAFDGIGLDVRQIKLRQQLYNDLGIQTLLLFFRLGTHEIYYKTLQKLEQAPPDKIFTTRNNIRIYDLSLFHKEEMFLERLYSTYNIDPETFHKIH